MCWKCLDSIRRDGGKNLLQYIIGHFLLKYQHLDLSLTLPASVFNVISMSSFYVTISSAGVISLPQLEVEFLS